MKGVFFFVSLVVTNSYIYIKNIPSSVWLPNRKDHQIVPSKRRSRLHISLFLGNFLVLVCGWSFVFSCAYTNDRKMNKDEKMLKEN
jgi:hypothetical protein